MRPSTYPARLLATSSFLGFVLFAAATAGAADPTDSRYPVTLTPSEALAQKAQMQTSLEALRRILGALATKDWAEVQKGVPDLGHASSAQKTVTTTVYKKMDAQFQEATTRVAAAAAAKDSDAVLRELGVTMGWCQSCHAALRQEVVPSEPEAASPGK